MKFRRLHEIPYSHRLTGVVAAGAVISGLAAVYCSVFTAAAASTLTNIVWLLGSCNGRIHKAVEVITNVIYEPTKEK